MMPLFGFSVLIPVVTLLSAIAGYGWMVWKVSEAKALIETLRQNDMHDLVTRLDRIEAKIDQHLAFHANKA